MSQWTHVTATIRVDAFNRDLTIEKLESIIGKPQGHGKPYLEEWEDDKVLPCGSEGSLEYTLYEDPDESNMAAYVITVFGDLRDYEDSDEIISWFESIVSEFDIRTRQAVLTIDVACQKIIYGAYVGYDDLQIAKFSYHVIDLY